MMFAIPHFKFDEATNRQVKKQYNAYYTGLKVVTDS